MLLGIHQYWGSHLQLDLSSGAITTKGASLLADKLSNAQTLKELRLNLLCNKMSLHGVVRRFHLMRQLPILETLYLNVNGNEDWGGSPSCG